jgi:hypothetical protein
MGSAWLPPLKQALASERFVPSKGIAFTMPTKEKSPAKEFFEGKQKAKGGSGT